MSGKQLLASFFGIRISDDKPVLETLVPSRISSEIMNGQLPTFRPTTIKLSANEVCHYMDRAALVVKKSERSYSSSKAGGGYRVSKNYRMYSSNRFTRPIDQEWHEYRTGVIFITNKRIIFVAAEDGFEKEISKLTSIIPYSDAVGLQFGNKITNFLTPQSHLMLSILQML